MIIKREKEKDKETLLYIYNRKLEYMKSFMKILTGNFLVCYDS